MLFTVGNLNLQVKEKVQKIKLNFVKMFYLINIIQMKLKLKYIKMKVLLDIILIDQNLKN